MVRVPLQIRRQVENSQGRIHSLVVKPGLGVRLMGDVLGGIQEKYLHVENLESGYSIPLFNIVFAYPRPRNIRFATTPLGKFGR